MPTEIIIPIQDPNGDAGSMRLLVSEDFDRVMDIVVPLQQPSSALEARERLILHKASDGERVLVKPEHIAIISASVEEE